MVGAKTETGSSVDPEVMNATVRMIAELSAQDLINFVCEEWKDPSYRLEDRLRAPLTDLKKCHASGGDLKAAFMELQGRDPIYAACIMVAAKHREELRAEIDSALSSVVMPGTVFQLQPPPAETHSTGELKTCGLFPNEPSALIACAVLRCAGIPAAHQPPGGGGGFWYLDAQLGVRVLVRPQDLPQALEVLQNSRCAVEEPQIRL